MILRRLTPLACAVFVLSTQPLSGEVVGDPKPYGFQVRNTVEIAATPQEIFRDFSAVDKWWDSAHTFTGKAENLYLTTEPGGWFGESLPKGGFVRHMQIINYAPASKIVLKGGLGPLQDEGVTATMVILLTEEGAATKVDLKYTVSGYFSYDSKQLAPVVDRVLAEQLGRLKLFVEKNH